VTYQKLSAFIKDEDLQKEMKTTYENLKKIREGAPSPDFSLLDINKQTVSPASLRGKTVYINIWATWCAPCMAEIPALKQLQNDLKDKNIQFVSICMNDSRERCLKTIKDKELKGVQIFAKSDSTKFYKDFSVIGIPRFIILDKNGIIYDHSALPPSSPKLKEELLKIL